MERRLYFALCFGFAALWALSLGQNLLHHLIPQHSLNFVDMLDVDREDSFYTWLSVCALFLVAVLLFLLSDRDDTPRAEVRYWFALGIIFLFLSADEALSFHNHLGKLIPASMRHGVLRAAWVLPAMLVVLAVGLYFLRFVLRLRPDLRRTVVMAGAIFVTGAAVLEVIGSMLSEAYGRESLPRVLEAALEEGMEVIGVLIFLRALLGELALGFAPVGHRHTRRDPSHEVTARSST